MFSLFKRIPLPPKNLRMGGAHFKDDAALVASALRDVENLEKLAGLNQNSRVYDWGCGAGRLAIGLLHRYKKFNGYVGVDAQKKLIDWAQSNLQRRGFKFLWADVANARYNSDGSKIRSLLVEPDSFEVFYAYSVFSHLDPEDALAYFKLVYEILVDGGKALITSFVEQNVEPWAENPENYGPLKWSGALHCARFEQNYFESLITEAGFKIVRFDYAQETDGQSRYILEK